ncbi:MAG TPA: universal stress protein [Gillisia sp.]|nr:universal stress protein [Gillisia sp.]
MKNILLPTDFSENAYNAALYGMELYREEQCNFILLNSFEVEGYYIGSVFVARPNEHVIETKEISSEQKLNDLKYKLESISHHRFETVFRNTHLEQAVNREIRSRDIEVVIIGTQGETAARDVAFGINTINLMENVTNCPVLAVPSHVKFAGIKEVVLPTGFKLEIVPGDLDYLISLVKNHHAPLRVLHIEESGLDTVQEDNRQTLASLLEPIPHSFHYLSFVSVPVGIYCFTESRGSDMIAFLNKKHSFFENLLFEPLYKRIGNFAQIPVLVMQKDNTDL